MLPESRQIPALPVTSGSLATDPRGDRVAIGRIIDRLGGREHPLDLLIVLVLLAVSAWGIVTAVVVTMILWCAVADGRARRTAPRVLGSSQGAPARVSTSRFDADSAELDSTLRRLDDGSRLVRSPVAGTGRAGGIRLVPFEATEQSSS
jgi:hypothetical protein